PYTTLFRSLLGQLLLGLPDVADLGDAVDPDRLQLLHGVHRLPAGVVRGLAALLRGGGGQGGEADDVTHRVDVRYLGAEDLVDHDPAALVRGEAGRVEVEQVARALAARGVHDGVGGDL